MSVKIRLLRAGTKHRPFYRVVVADSRAPRDGRFIEMLGYYDPLPETAVLDLDAQRLDEWIKRGATPSETVSSLLKKAGQLPSAAAIAAEAQARRTTMVEEANRLAPQRPVKSSEKADRPDKPAREAQATRSAKTDGAGQADKPAQPDAAPAAPTGGAPESAAADGPPAEADKG